MTISVQKSASTSQVNLQGLQQTINVLKIPALNAFTGEREKLQAFLIKLKLYIEFNQTKFRFKMNKGLFTVFFSRMQHLIELTSNCMSFLTRHQRNR